MSASRPAGKRAETLWQGVVLFLVLLLTIGIYTGLLVVVRRLRGAEQARQPAAMPPLAGAVQIVEPLADSLWQAGQPIPVRVMLLAPHLDKVEFLVDGQVMATRFNANPAQASTWQAEWIWEGAGEGSHTLTVEARSAAQGQAVSWATVTVTVVPTGQIVFASNRDGAYALYAMQTDGRATSRLTIGPGDARQPTVRTDGTLAFVAAGANGQAAIRQMARGNGAETDLFSGREPTWSPDGKRLAFTVSREGISQVVVAAVNGEPTLITAEEIYAGQPSWSPDGKRLAYVAERDHNADIWVVVLDGGEAQRLTDDPALDWAPAWSPDGGWLAFVSNRSGSHQIYVMRADGRDQHPLTDMAQGAESPAWSPDGYWLAFVAYRGEGTGVNAREIYLMRADGQEQVRLTHNSYDDTEPDWARTDFKTSEVW